MAGQQVMRIEEHHHRDQDKWLLSLYFIDSSSSGAKSLNFNIKPRPNYLASFVPPAPW